MSAIGQAGMRIGMFVLISSGVLLLLLERDSAEYSLMLFTFVLGLLFTVLVAIWVRWSQRKFR